MISKSPFAHPFRLCLRVQVALVVPENTEQLQMEQKSKSKRITVNCLDTCLGFTLALTLYS